MIINLEEILEDGLYLEFDERPGFFPTLSEINESGELLFTHPVKIRLKAIRIRDLIEIEGTFETTYALTCSRCLNEFSSPLQNEFSLTYTKNIPDYTDDYDKEGRELKAEEMGLILFKGNKINLRDGIQEQLIMSIPQRSLCSEDCKGLCPKCGKNLNDSHCNCEDENIDTRLAILKNFIPAK